MSSISGPTNDDLQRLLDRLRPRIARLFDRHGVTVEEAESRVADALVRLSYRWDLIRDRERWLLATLEKDLEMHPEESSKEPRDE